MWPLLFSASPFFFLFDFFFILIFFCWSVLNYLGDDKIIDFFADYMDMVYIFFRLESEFMIDVVEEEQIEIEIDGNEEIW